MMLPEDLATDPAPQASEPVYAYRRKGLSYFCTCERKQYEELVTKPNMFEVTVFYPTPQPTKPCERCAELEAEAKARKQAQADLETYKGRCTDLEHQNERLEAENAKPLRVTRQQAEASADLLNEKQATIAQQAEQLAAAQKVIDAAGNLIAQKGRHNTEIAYKRLAKAIAEQKEGK